jgi:tripeptidyl-peptidase-1
VPNLRLDEYTNTNEPFLEFFQHLMTLENDEVAQVISISYGDDEQVKISIPSYNHKATHGLNTPG